MPEPPISRRAQIATAAVKAGHRVDVNREGKRFRLECSCGWHTDSRWTRKRSIEAATDHVIREGRAALGEPATVNRVSVPATDVSRL